MSPHLPASSFFVLWLRRLLFAGLSLLAAARPGWAAEAARSFDVPAGPAIETLRVAARQAAVEIVFPAAVVAGVTTAPIRGSYSTREALALMLDRTGLEAVVNERSGAFTVRPVATADAIRPAPGAATESAGVLELQRMVVTGSQIARTNDQTVQPVTVLTDEAIREGSVGTPMELMNRLPYLGSLSAYENQDGGRSRGSGSSINLRGLGGQNTLILLNGRRLPYYSLPLGSLVFYNVNNLPLAAVSRVEVLRDGASAIYGADATAGVVNFITHGQAPRRSVTVRYGDTTDGSASELRGTALFSGQAADARTRYTLVLDAYNRDPLMAADVPFAALGDKRGRVAEPFGSAAAWNSLSNIGPYGTFTVVAATGQPNRLPGLTTNTAYTADDGTIQAGARTPANYYNDGENFSVVPGRKSRDVYFAVDRELLRGVELFTELSYNEANSEAIQSPMTLASTQNRDANDQVMVVPATNYYNPFGTRFFGPGTANPTVAPRAVQFNFVEEAIGPRIGRIDTRQVRGLAGLRSQAGGRWDWETAAMLATNRARDTTENMISRSALTAALARSTPDAINLFAGPGANPESVLAPLRTTSYIGGRSQLALWDGKISGAIYELPTGPLAAAIGTEYREEKLRSDYSANYVANDLVNTAGQDNFTADRDVRSAFAELQVPLLADSSRPWFARAEAQVAVRWEDISGYGSTTKPKVGAVTTVLPGVLVRASVGGGFRAPTLTQLYGAEGRSMAARVDPFRPQDGNVRRLIRQPAVPTLRPEESESRTVGLVLEPKFAPGLSVSVDAWDYEITDQINVVSRDLQLAIEAAGGAYSNPNVVRSAPTADQPIGPITAIIEPWQNFARAETRGYDFGVAYVRGSRDGLRVTLGTEASYVDTFVQQTEPGGPEVSFPIDQGRPRLRTVSRLELERRAWKLQLLHRYTADYLPPDPVVVGTESYRIPSYTVWDATVSRQFAATRWTREATVTLGLNNVFDEDPPLYPTRQGYDARMASPQGQFAFVNVTFTY